MTSTNMFNGFANDRKSSRVLRPPGGGQTDVLGVRSAPEAPRTKNAARATVEEPRILNSIISTVVEEPQIKNSTPQKTETPKPVSVDKPKPKVETAAAHPVAAPTRTRVPPGGFSSGGFW